MVQGGRRGGGSEEVEAEEVGWGKAVRTLPTRRGGAASGGPRGASLDLACRAGLYPGSFPFALQVGPPSSPEQGPSAPSAHDPPQGNTRTLGSRAGSLRPGLALQGEVRSARSWGALGGVGQW